MVSRFPFHTTVCLRLCMQCSGLFSSNRRRLPFVVAVAMHQRKQIAGPVGQHTTDGYHASFFSLRSDELLPSYSYYLKHTTIHESQCHVDRPTAVASLMFTSQPGSRLPTDGTDVTRRCGQYSPAVQFGSCAGRRAAGPFERRGTLTPGPED